MGARHAHDLEELLRVQAARTVLFHVAVAHRAGLNVTDLTCLSLLDVEGAMSPGALATHLGLSRGGAVTSAIDRLEVAGLVRRRRDPADGRRTVVEATPDAVARVGPLYADFARRWAAWAGGLSADELGLLADFADASAAMLRDAAIALREGSPD